MYWLIILSYEIFLPLKLYCPYCPYYTLLLFRTACGVKLGYHMYYASVLIQTVTGHISGTVAALVPYHALKRTAVQQLFRNPVPELCLNSLAPLPTDL